VVSGRTLCEYHLEQHRIAVQKMKKIYKEEGRCPQCGAYLNDDIDKHCVYCINCRERNMSIRGNKNEITRKDIT
jgi:Zn finger protein HypA/HybF involved in hydrogenase expression